MRTAITILTAALAIGSTACKKDKDKAPPATGSAPAVGSADMAGSAAMGSATGSADMAGSAAMGSAAGSGDMAGSAAMGSAAAPDEPEMAKKAGNCPSTVFGAITKAEVKGKDVVLTITSEDKDAVQAIQKRTEALLKEKADGAAAGTGHDQKGSHGGGVGLCPVFYGEGGTAKQKKDAKGVVVTITPKIKPEELKATIDERITKAAAWVEKNVKPAPEGNSAGTGGGKGAHGSTHQGAGDSKGKERKDGTGGGAGTGGGGGKGTGGGGEKKDEKKGT